jgi:hypothetical protein
MAKITYNPAVHHMHGAVGRMVFKETFGQDIVAVKPDQVVQPNTPAQQQQRESFRQGARYAKNVLADPQAKIPYVTKAKALHVRPFALAVKDFLTPPAVDVIDLSQYNKHVGDAIVIQAHDDLEVTSVDVVLKDQSQAPIEAGTATFDATSGAWKYTATVDASSKASVTVTAVAHDHPGHTGTLTATK